MLSGINPFVERPPNSIDIHEPANEAMLRLSNPRIRGENPAMAMPLQNPPQTPQEREKNAKPSQPSRNANALFGLVFGAINNGEVGWTTRCVPLPRVIDAQAV